MAKNESGTYVHVHSEGGGTTVVEPGGDFPKGFEPTPDLTSASEEEEYEVPGPGQFLAHVKRGTSPAEPRQWKDFKVPELREALSKAGVEYTEDDRKDALVAKAEGAGLDPNLHAADGREAN